MNIKFISKMILRGSLTLLPLLLTIYPFYYFFKWLDSLSNDLIQYIFPGMSYLPGTGIVLGLLTVFLLGAVMSAAFMQRLYKLIEIPIKKVPLVKTLYTAIKELVYFLAPDQDEKHANKVVIIRIPGTEIDTVGFILRNDLSFLPDSIDKNDRVAVYVPMSYQIGGFTLFLPRSMLKNIDMPVEDAMKDVLTGWISTKQSVNM